jgi:FlaA1/EpsC-like NDP-sugar epimerase
MISQLREIEMEDLLGRDPVRIDLMQVSAYIRNKTVLVTGAGGSIGSELCRQIVGFEPRLLVVIDVCENNLFDIEMELRDLKTKTVIAAELVDVKNRDGLEAACKRYLPQLIFHAAAYKHVPLMERHPQEAVHNNVLGTRNVAEMADKYGAETFILISTDKAVNPTSVMGATKRLAELVIKDINRNSDTCFAAVRFGNVLGSRGSVIPTFKQQIKRGGPVTVTHPDMERFFMTIPEAVQLVIQAGAIAKGGEIFVLNMGEPIKIADMARDLIRLYGYEPGRDIEIKFTGIRPGEKLYEELFSGREELAATRHERIFISKKELDENYLEINKKIYNLCMNAGSERSAIINLLASLLPEYQKSDYQSASELKIPANSVVYMEESLNQRRLGS